MLDPCYAVAEPGTGDGTGVVCLSSPFGTGLSAITRATGLNALAPLGYDEPYGLVLASGTRCVQLGGAHGVYRGRPIDYQCDDGQTLLLRGIHNTGPLWTADLAGGGSQAITSAVLLEHQIPPANRPVTDATTATDDELDAVARIHHEVDCGRQQVRVQSAVRQRIYVNAVDCLDATGVVAEFNHHQALDRGWTCATDTRGNLLCLRAPAAGAPAFFAAAHIRAVATAD